MSRRRKDSDLRFEISFCESILRQDRNFEEVIELLAGLYTQAGRIDDGLALDQQLIGLQPDNPTAHYNFACSLALKGRKPEAVERLRIAISKGYDDFKWLTQDPDLKPLSAYPPFEEMLDQFQIRQR
jgi:tetratricopeptide (TPR) repeat protein